MKDLTSSVMAIHEKKKYFGLLYMDKKQFRTIYKNISIDKMTRNIYIVCDTISSI